LSAERWAAVEIGAQGKNEGTDRGAAGGFQRWRRDRTVERNDARLLTGSRGPGCAEISAPLDTTTV